VLGDHYSSYDSRKNMQYCLFRRGELEPRSLQIKVNARATEPSPQGS